MALNKEILKASKVLTDLTDEQIAEITTLSSNDENSVIGSRIGEIYRNLDSTIEKETGIKRDGDEKTYNYLARAAKSMKEQLSSLDTYKEQVAALNEEKSRLEDVIKTKGSDKESLAKLEQAQKDLNSIKEQYNTLQNTYQESEKKHQNELFGMKIDTELKSSLGKVALKKGISENLLKVAVNQAMNEVKSLNPTYEGDKLIFHDKTGANMMNPTNHLEPYTASELLSQKLKEFGVVDEGRKAGGAGTTPPAGGNQGGVIDISGAKTRLEANSIIEKTLLSQGLTKGSEKFTKASTEAWRENNVSELPEQ